MISEIRILEEAEYVQNKYIRIVTIYFLFLAK